MLFILSVRSFVYIEDSRSPMRLLVYDEHPMLRTMNSYSVAVPICGNLPPIFVSLINNCYGSLCQMHYEIYKLWICLYSIIYGLQNITRNDEFCMSHVSKKLCWCVVRLISISKEFVTFELKISWQIVHQTDATDTCLYFYK